MIAPVPVQNIDQGINRMDLIAETARIDYRGKVGKNLGQMVKILFHRPARIVQLRIGACQRTLEIISQLLVAIIVPFDKRVWYPPNCSGTTHPVPFPHAPRYDGGMLEKMAHRAALPTTALSLVFVAAVFATGFYLGRLSAPTLIILEPISHGDSNQTDRSRIVEDLITRGDEIIPVDGVLGGTMGFHARDEIHVLGDRWVFAPFEDGHIGGHMLLEYSVDRSGKIHWTVLATERF